MIALTCHKCGASLQVTDDMEVFACVHCGTNYQVNRAGGTVALKRLEAHLESVSESSNRQAAELALVRLRTELDELRAHSSKLEKQRASAIKDDYNGSATVLTVLTVVGLPVAMGVGWTMWEGMGCIAATAVAIFTIFLLAQIVGARVRASVKLRFEGAQRKTHAMIASKEAEYSRWYQLVADVPPTTPDPVVPLNGPNARAATHQQDSMLSGCGPFLLLIAVVIVLCAFVVASLSLMSAGSSSSPSTTESLSPDQEVPATTADSLPPDQKVSASTTESLAPDQEIEKAPSWYQGSKPWTELSEEGRQAILNVRSRYEADQSRAGEPAQTEVDPLLAQAGQALIANICDEYGIDSYYKTPRMFGPRTVIWLPEAAWAKLDESQRQSIAAYMKSKYASWGIGIGRVSGRDVMADRIVKEAEPQALLEEAKKSAQEALEAVREKAQEAGEAADAAKKENR